MALAHARTAVHLETRSSPGTRDGERRGRRSAECIAADLHENWQRVALGLACDVCTYIIVVISSNTSCISSRTEVYCST